MRYYSAWASDSSGENANKNGSYGSVTNCKNKHSSKTDCVLYITWRFIALLLSWDSLTKQMVHPISRQVMTLTGTNFQSALKQQTHGKGDLFLL